jgi:hypothetical protein
MSEDIYVCILQPHNELPNPKHYQYRDWETLNLVGEDAQNLADHRWCYSILHIW